MHIEDQTTKCLSPPSENIVNSMEFSLMWVKKKEQSCPEVKLDVSLPKISPICLNIYVERWWKSVELALNFIRLSLKSNHNELNMFRMRKSEWHSWMYSRGGSTLYYIILSKVLNFCSKTHFMQQDLHLLFYRSSTFFTVSFGFASVQMTNFAEESRWETQILGISIQNWVHGIISNKKWVKYHLRMQVWACVEAALSFVWFG